MKIQSGEPLPGLARVPPKTAGGSKTGSFNDMLAKTLGAKHPAQVPAASLAAAVVRPIASAPLSVELYRTTERVLEALERYRCALGDTRATLKDVEPSVQALKKAATDLAPLVEADSDHPAWQTALRTLLTAVKEIARFDRGAYVDD
jgi:hypothetical protein